MTTVSFDFDFTFWNPDAQAFIWDSVDLAYDHLAKGDRVIIVTSRPLRVIDDVRDLLKSIDLVIDVYSAPGHPGWDTLTTKSDVLLVQNVTIHYDDAPLWGGLDAARDAGVQIVLPPCVRGIKK